MKNSLMKIFYTLILLTFLFIPTTLLAAGTGDTEVKQIQSELLFWVLLVLAIILVFVIYALTKVTEYIVRKKQEETRRQDITAKMITLPFILFAAKLSAAQGTVQKAASVWQDPYMPMYGLLALLVVIILGQSLVIFNYMRKTVPAKAIVEKENWLERFWQKINPTVPIEKENDILLDDHEYDGIRELDNGMPPWLRFLFNVTVVFGVVYSVYYLSGMGLTQDEKYDKAIAKAEIEKQERMKDAQNFVDETTVQLIQSAEVLASGKEIYLTNCAACHTATGGGETGPNLTDDYWVHGGSINDIFKTIKYGVPAKGMIAWQNSLSPRQISEVANFIKSLRGTNPPGAIPAAGVLYVEGQENSIDSIKAKADSIMMDTTKSMLQ
ncbi:MAG: cbb3-type cytochrome c oxidase N-terminal domain-containing protein [Chitinophagales bacterium]